MTDVSRRAGGGFFVWYFDFLRLKNEETKNFGLGPSIFVVAFPQDLVPSVRREGERERGRGKGRGGESATRGEVGRRFE